ncbi:MAG: hypothetical protein CVU11_01960 [Bacteroidetes bacterium HGW-Bacteroidetes-6]|jgi:thioredoxin-like negative regulator of GroEL|nr:MAG: hypothetical protein CVU11_01960 [Bacteroidetes bacterium HGW-Bacteroidetes-6]
MDWFQGSPQELEDAVSGSPISAFYISTENCNVCNSLRPKIVEFFSEKFPDVHLTIFRSELYPRWSAQNSIFTAPVLLIFADGKEAMRFGRSISFSELEEKLDRLQELMG